MPAPPLKGFVTAQDAGRSCPYCRFALKEGEGAAWCPTCNASHHADCWTDNGGCAVMGCLSGPGAGKAAPPVAEPTIGAQMPAPGEAPPMPPAPSPAGNRRWLVGAILVLAFVIAA